MDRGFLAALLAFALLAPRFSAVGSLTTTLQWRLRVLTADGEQGRLGVNSTNQTTQVPAGPPPSPKNTSSRPPPGIGLTPPPVQVNLSIPPAPVQNSSPPLALQKQPSPPPPETPSSEGPPPAPPGGSKSGSPVKLPPSAAGGEPPPKGSGGQGTGKPSGDKDDGVKCTGVSKQCTENVTFCFWQPENDVKNSLLVRNDGNTSVVVLLLSSLSPYGNPISIEMNHSKKVPLPSDADLNKIILKVGENKCPLSFAPQGSMDNFWQLPVYATSIYGAYAILFTALVAGGTWVCCKCRKRLRKDSGIPYQQIEMGVHESTAAVDANGVEGWDQGWDNEWEDEDEETGRRSMEIQHTSSISTNSTVVPLSKPPAKDDWEDWDD